MRKILPDEVHVHRPIEIQYGDFYDFPRMFIVIDGGNRYLFDGSFEDQLDDYPAEFVVYLMPELTRDELAGSWAQFPQRALRRLGRVPTREVTFDPTRRKTIDGAILDRFRPGHIHGRAV